MRRRVITIVVLAALAAAIPAVAVEPDWFTRVKEQGLETASETEVARHAKGVVPDSLHAGECYFHLRRYAEGVEVFSRLRRSPDQNYAAMALAKRGEGLFHLGKTEEARAAFRECLEEYPEAWLDGSVPELCRAWLRKLDGTLSNPDADDAGDADSENAKAAGGEPSLDAVRAEIRDLTKRLEELRKLIGELEDD